MVAIVKTAQKAALAALLATGMATAAAAQESCTFGVTFAFDSADLTPEAMTVLDELNLRYPSAPKRIAGYTDAVGSDGYNLVLSQRRAEAVAAYLNSLGETSNVSMVEALGETQLLVNTQGPEAANRRAVIEVTGVSCDEFADLAGSTNVAFGALPLLVLIPILTGGGGTTTTTTTTGTP